MTSLSQPPDPSRSALKFLSLALAAPVVPTEPPTEPLRQTYFRC